MSPFKQSQNGAWRRTKLMIANAKSSIRNRRFSVIVADRVGDLDLNGVDENSVASNGESPIH